MCSGWLIQIHMKPSLIIAAVINPFWLMLLFKLLWLVYMIFTDVSAVVLKFILINTDVPTVVISSFSLIQMYQLLWLAHSD